MQPILKFVATLVLAISVIGCSEKQQAADLGKVLDRASLALKEYQGNLQKENVTQASDKQIAQFTDYLQQRMNADPKFYDKPISVQLLKDASFSGFVDKNINGTLDKDENQLFKLEVDGDNSRLIATDAEGRAASQGFSGSGFMAGALMGMLLGRQRGAGIGAGAFNNRKVTPRSAYTAPRSASSGSSARSRTRSGGMSRGK